MWKVDSKNSEMLQSLETPQESVAFINTLQKTSAFRINPKDKGKQNHRISEEFDHLLRLCQQQQSSSASTGYWRITSKGSLKHVQLHQASPILVAQLQSTSQKQCVCSTKVRERPGQNCGLWMIQRFLNDTNHFSRILQERPTSNAYHSLNISKLGMGPYMTIHPSFSKKSGE